MIILGNKYNFTEAELQEIKSRFSDIVNISYKDSNPKDVKTKLQEVLENNNHTLIVLNTAAPIPSELISYFVSFEIKGVSYISVENFLEKYLQKCYIQTNNTDISFLEEIKPYTKWQYIQKRVIDYFAVFVLFFFTWPVMLYAAYRIKKESPDGDVFFKQKRVGKDGRVFECVKFRSMRTDVKYFNHYTQENDPRIFPWGNTMRKYRIDEIPQMINVIKGEMHTIGPRAEWNELVEKYIKEIPVSYTHLTLPTKA